MKSRVDVFAPQKLEVQKLARMPIFEPHPCRQGRRAYKAMPSFHKNNIFVKTRTVMGNTDVAHYRGHLV